MYGLKFLGILLLLADAEADLHCSTFEELKEKKDEGFSYICWKGQWRAWACRVPGDGSVVIAGQKFIAATGSVLYECGWASATDLQLRAVACLTSDKVVVYPMQELITSGYSLTCLRRSLMELSLKVEKKSASEIHGWNGVILKSMPSDLPPPPPPSTTPSPTTAPAKATIDASTAITKAILPDPPPPSSTAVPAKATVDKDGVTVKMNTPILPGPPSPPPSKPQQQLAPMASPLVSIQSQQPQKPSPAFITESASSKDQCAFDGKMYPVGASMELSGAWYTCTKGNGKAPEPSLTGCVAPSGAKYRLGERSENKFFAFRCDPLGNIAVLTGYACIERYPNGTTTELPIGRRWLVGAATKNSRYIMQCSSDGAFNIRRQAVLCFYNTTYGTGVLPGGCMLNVGDVLVQCMPHSRTWPNVRVRVKENPSPSDKQRIESEGDLKYCNGSPLPEDVLL